MTERKKIPYGERKFDKAKRNAYDMQYKKDNFDRVSFYVPKGTRELIKERAAKEGLSMSEWLKKLIDEAM